MIQSKTYVMSDPAAVAAKVKVAGGPALDPSRVTGQASENGVTLGWSINEGQVVVTILRKPWMIATSAIWSRVDAVLG